VDAAAARVDLIWGTGWPRTVVVIVPQDQDQLAAALGRPDTAGLKQVAAITTGSTGAAGNAPGTVDRVVLNPAPFTRLTPLGRRVVLTHELTHVATRATARVSPPLWVEEGFANYVAYRGSGLSRGVIAADVLPFVRAGTAAAHLPTADDFDPARGLIAPAYADAWLAFDLMAADQPRRPVDFFRAAAGIIGSATPPRSADQTVAAAFRRVLGTDQGGFEARWRAHREALVRPLR
jgi:hypothetical protein